MSDAPVRTCPKCKKKKVERLISRTAFQLKGGGWYADLYSSSKPGEAKDGKAAEAKSSSGESSSASGGSSGESSAKASADGVKSSGSSGKSSSKKKETSAKKADTRAA